MLLIKISDFLLIPDLFEKIGKILFNIIKIIGWFLKVVVMKGFKLIKAIIDFIIALGKKTTQKISIPDWATTENPILKIPSILEYVKKIIDLPFKTFFETITKDLENVKNTFSKIGNWFKNIKNNITSLINGVITGFLKAIKGIVKGIKITFSIIKGMLKSIGIPLGDLIDDGLLSKLNVVDSLDESKFTI